MEFLPYEHLPPLVAPPVQSGMRESPYRPTVARCDLPLGRAWGDLLVVSVTEHHASVGFRPSYAR